jgi:aminotransferase in exopolysaccharide biosynthesis
MAPHQEPFLPLSVPVLRGREWEYVKECLDTGWVSTAGSYVGRFERVVAEFTGARHAIACVNGTSALHLALEVAGVQPEDEVLVPTLTFIATINAVHYTGAHPVFFDCDEFYCLDPAGVMAFLAGETTWRDGHVWNRRTGRRISAIVPVHVFGNAVHFDALLPELQERNIAVVEDAAEALGTVYSDGPFAGRHAGTIGKAGCLSFNGNKIITTGGGGMVLTDDDAFAERVRYLSTQAKDDPVRFVHNAVGYNHRLTNIQAALGVAQMEQLDDYIRTKKRNYELYVSAVAGIPGLRIAPTPPFAKSNYWFYALQIDDAYGCDREHVMACLDARHIQTRPVWELNHRQKPYAAEQQFRISRAPDLHRKTLNLPCSADLSEAAVARVCEVLRTIPSDTSVRCHVDA